MKLVTLAAVAMMVAGSAAAAQAPERRCGWLHNPTPANFWLRDRHGEWLLGAQGGYQAPGMDDLPDMTTRGWVAVNGHYGHGCACITGGVDRRTRRFTRIDRGAPVPLQQCRRDRALPRPD